MFKPYYYILIIFCNKFIIKLKAHYQKRKAERLTRQGVFKGAIECHGKAADLIANVLHCCEGPTVRQSLVCQREHHFRQIWLLQSKITLLRQYRQQRMNSTKGNSCSVTDSEYDRKIKDLQSDIMRFIPLFLEKD